MRTLTLHLTSVGLMVIGTVLLSGCESRESKYQAQLQRAEEARAAGFGNLPEHPPSGFEVLPSSPRYGGGEVEAYSYQSGNTYSLDADVSDREVDRLHFSNGGHVDLYNCELDRDGEAECVDEEGRYWDIEGEPDDIWDDGVGYDEDGVYGYDEDGDGLVDEEW